MGWPPRYWKTPRADSVALCRYGVAVASCYAAENDALPGKRSVDPYLRVHAGMPGWAAPFHALSLQFGRVANILRFVDCQSDNSATSDVQSTGKETHRGYCGELFGRHLMIRSVVACVVFDAVGTPTAGSFQRNKASRDHRGRDHIMKRLCGALCWIVLLTVIVPRRIPGNRLVAAV